MLERKLPVPYMQLDLLLTDLQWIGTGREVSRHAEQRPESPGGGSRKQLVVVAVEMHTRLGAGLIGTFDGDLNGFALLRRSV